MPELNISWFDYHRKVEILASKIYQSGWEFNQIICIAKGGLRIGDIFCRLFNKPLAILGAKSYGGDKNRTKGELTIADQLLMLEPHVGNKVLLVDDLADSGITLQQSSLWLQKILSPEIEELRTAVIWVKETSSIIPDYHVEQIPANVWVCQPFECYEQMSPKDIR